MKAVIQKLILIAIIAFGSGLYLVPAGIVSTRPEVVSQLAFTFLKDRFHREIQTRIDNLCEITEGEREMMRRFAAVAEKVEVGEDSPTIGKIIKFTGEYAREEADLSERLQERDLCEELAERVDRAIAQTQAPGDFPAKPLSLVIAETDSEKFPWLKPILNSLSEAFSEEWEHVTQKLLQEIRRFLWINGGAFFLLGLIAIFRPQSITALLLPSALLLLSSLITTAIYVFSQDWFFTILYEKYWGWMTALYLAVVFVLLIDIAFNKARISLRVMETICHLVSGVIGSVFG